MDIYNKVVEGMKNLGNEASESNDCISGNVNRTWERKTIIKIEINKLEINKRIKNLSNKAMRK